MSPTWKRAERSALKVALLYLLFGCLWILLTDKLLYYWVHDLDQLQAWQNSKGILFVMLSCVLIFFSNRYETQRRLRAETDMIEMEARTKEFVLNANEEERNRISSELHDGVQQELAGISMMVQMLKEEEGNELSARIDEVRASLDKSIQEVRKVSHYNSSFQIEEKGVTEAIEDLFHQLEHEKKVQYSLDIRPIRERKLNYFTAVNLYRITQELLQNVQKHSDADQIDLAIEKNGSDSFVYRFWENGTRKEKGKDGFGKRSIRRRVQCLGGRLLKTEPEWGKEIAFLFLDLDREALRQRFIQERFDGNFLPLEKQALNLIQ